MAKYDEWITDDGLLKIEGYARDGLTDAQIAENMGIGLSTLKDWKKKFPSILAALKQGKEVVDRHVENALYKRAIGFSEVERKYEPAPMDPAERHLRQKIAMAKYKEENPKATQDELELVAMQVPKYKMEVVEEKDKIFPPDVTAQIFWLKNRKMREWRDKQEISQENSGEIRVVFSDDMKKWSE